MVEKKKPRIRRRERERERKAEVRLTGSLVTGFPTSHLHHDHKSRRTVSKQANKLAEITQKLLNMKDL